MLSAPNPSAVPLYNNLMKFGQPGHERLFFNEQTFEIETAPKAAWYKRPLEKMYKPENFRLRFVVETALSHFETNTDQSSERVEAMENLWSLIVKIKNSDEAHYFGDKAIALQYGKKWPPVPSHQSWQH